MTDQPFPYTHPAGSDADMFIQWKGTDLCMDFHCPCGAESHVDSNFAYAVRCPGCGAVYEMGCQVIVKRNDDYPGNVVDLDTGYIS